MNWQFFNSSLPTPIITSEITPFGGCLGSTQQGGHLTIPHIRIHPAMCNHEGRVNQSAWGGEIVEGQVYPLMIHEMTHISQKMPELFKLTGETSHNAENWVIEANRMSEAWDLPRCCRRWVIKREGKSTARRPKLDEPTANTFIPDLTMRHVGGWPDGVAKVIHPDLEGWIASCVKRLNLPRF